MEGTQDLGPSPPHFGPGQGLDLGVKDEVIVEVGQSLVFIPEDENEVLSVFQQRPFSGDDNAAFGCCPHLV